MRDDEFLISSLFGGPVLVRTPWRPIRVAVALVAVVVAMVAGIAATAPVPAAELSCGDGVVVLGARGSSEKETDGQGLGRPGFTTYTALINSLSQKGFKQRVRAQFVRYPASDVSALLSRDGFAKYFGGIDQGVANARQQLNDITRGFTSSGTRCDGPRVVLVGYSQGAMVMHRLLRQLAPGGSNPSADLLKRIGGAILIGDGDKQVGDTNHIYAGTTYATRGIGQQVNNRDVTGTDPAPLPASVRDRTYAVCANFDIVCDAPSQQFVTFAFSVPPFFNYAFVPRASAGVAIHVSRYGGSLAYTSGEFGATNDLATQLIRAIPPTPATPPTGPPSTTPPATTPQPTSPPSTSPPSSIVNGCHPWQDAGINQLYSVCTGVLEGVRTDGSNPASVDYRPDGGVYGDSADVLTTRASPTVSGAAALAAIGLSAGEPTPPNFVPIRLQGTPTAPPGDYPYEVSWTTARFPTPQMSIWYVRIAAP